mmetsp:Transcript_20401/g.26458  ORF Transcript_20401/g.26458 Transcript_20401/m.26458 type:complete len:193 (+) Transcript_20401:76-654(+)
MEEIAANAAASVPSSNAVPLLKTILKNLSRDPANPKYRRIRMDGAAGQKLNQVPETMSTLAMVGFQEERTEDGLFLCVASENPGPIAAAALVALERVHPPNSFSAPALLATAPKQIQQEKLSLKAQARRDAEARRQAELEAARKHREEIKKQIERDNRARREDPNWKPGNGVSKGGRDIDTFRGKYGEDRGG